MMMRDSLVFGSAAALLVACSSPGNESSGGGSAGSGATVGLAGNAGSTPSAESSGAAAGGMSGAGSGVSGGAGASGGVGGASGGAPSGGNGGTVSNGGAGASGMSGGGVGGTSGSAGSAGSDGDTVSACLPSGQEKLLIKITGQPSLDVTTPSTLTCLSRFLPAQDSDPAELSLVWNTSDGSITATLRQDDVAPGQTGTFTPFAVIIAHYPDAWLAVPNKCHVTISTNDKIGEEHPSGAPASDVYKVSGSMACDAGWALGNETGSLDKFEFTTRVVFTHSP